MYRYIHAHFSWTDRKKRRGGAVKSKAPKQSKTTMAKTLVWKAPDDAMQPFHRVQPPVHGPHGKWARNVGRSTGHADNLENMSMGEWFLGEFVKWENI